MLNTDATEPQLTVEDTDVTDNLCNPCLSRRQVFFHLCNLWFFHFFNISKKASCGKSTEPILFILFFPFFCFSRSFLFLVMSPP